MCGQGLCYNVHLLLAKSEELVCRRKMAVIFNMINLFCELWKSWMYFSQGILRETHRSFLNFILFYFISFAKKTNKQTNRKNVGRDTATAVHGQLQRARKYKDLCDRKKPIVSVT